ncbi:hypothetical protein VE01_03314 [Pseudogymnoascus verrucosus]|uniref:Zn(2)-C6 fungal-type domain-containing protein n=1 Tax=Pseudogymnoascus verrucosus TaxID=342668 RepID=A0A1B8GS78_9PEZI|nr:uncharacterized protein VE01_03314 [Pseudogymnoascus verrucosus]OBT98686.1 hypothetical protein VE01_03314 [Pseudogymnoascus verrucosus]
MSRPLKRLKVRKKTFSCWECKRRKIRCEVTPPCSVCLSCQQRGLLCVSQEFVVDNESAGESESRGQMENNLDRVETLVDQLLRQRGQQEQKNKSPNRTMLLSVPQSISSFSVGRYLYSILPPPATTAVIIEHGKFTLMPTPTGRAVGAVQQEPPPPSAHPVQFARRLIRLAICLQQSNGQVDEAARYIEIASQHVMSKDDLMNSLDGLEALTLEATYHINNGNPRVAWLRFRRALAIAQLLGLGVTEMTDRAEGIWFLLLMADRYMSLRLGLPFAVEDNNFSDPRGDALSKLKYIHVVVSGRIIARNLRMQRQGEPEYDETLKIDYSLKQVARSLPSDWWSFSSLHGLAAADVLEKTSTLSAQLTHHYLIVVLHQPYIVKSLVSPTTNEHVSYSKLVVCSASREVLLRFLVIRSFHRGGSYFGFEEKACTAMCVLLLAHIDGYRLGQANSLEHQRPQDLALVNNVLSLLEEMHVPNFEVEILKKLVGIEEQVADGANYSWMKKSGAGLELTMPYFGTVCWVLMSPREQVIHQETSLPPSSDTAGLLDFLDMLEESPLFDQA